MKKQTIFKILSLTLGLLLLGFVAVAQNAPSDEEKEAEKRVRQAELERQHQELKEQQYTITDLSHEYAGQAGTSVRGSTVFVSRSTGDEDNYFIYSGGQENHSQLTLRNSFRGESDTSNGEFDVDDNCSQFRCTINGKVRSGKISIKLLLPGGKVYKNLSITSSAEITFTQSISFDEENMNKYVGAWKYEVKAVDAEGNYTLSINTR
jgi:hypothetical protein